MTVILKLRDEKETTAIPQTVHGYVVEMFDTVGEFKNYIKVELKELLSRLADDGIQDKQLDNIVYNESSYTFNVLLDKYLEYNDNEIVEII